NNLKLLDDGKNSIACLDRLGHLQQLERLWLNNNMITQWTEVGKLGKLANLENVHLKGNPIETQDVNNYRRKVIQALPKVARVDDIPCR
ncbi:leucine Rich Repeat family protein, partial [Aphelenchoides avenae]